MVGLADHRGVVRGADHGLAVLVSGGREQRRDGPGVGLVLPGGRLVDDQQPASAGQRPGQRLALARALASARGLLIVDEPTSRQDENNARAVAALLTAAAHDEGQTVICATHDPAVIRQADNVVRLDG